MKHPPTLIEVLEDRSRVAPNAPTFDRLSLSELRRSALQIATALRERELSGRAVLVAAPAGIEYVKSLLGCLYAGAIAVPAYPPSATRLSRANERIASILEDADVSCALFGSGTTLHSELAVETLSVADLTIGAPEPTFDWELDSERACLLQYTSGSTSTPKGVGISMRQLTANLVAIRDATRLTSADVLVTWLPPYHDMGLIGGIFWPLYVGLSTTILPPETFIRRPLRWLQLITERRATVTMAPNFAFDLCVRRISEQQRAELDLSSLRVVCNGAEPIHPGTLERFADAFAPCGFDLRAFYPCYGLAESTLFVAGGRPGRSPVVLEVDSAELEGHRVREVSASDHDEQTTAITRLVGCGRAGTNSQIRIVEPESARCLADGQVGEIWVSGPSVALGYYRRPDETRFSFEARLADSDEGPYLRTGDLGFIRAGELFVTGRLKDLIIVRGQNHYPHDLERTVQALHPALAQGPGAAFSIQADGEEQVVVVQELDHRQGGDPAQLLFAVLEAVRAHHALAVHAAVFVRRGTIERTASGKVQRQRTRQSFLEGRLDVVARWDAGAVSRERVAEEAVPASESRITHTRPVRAGQRRTAIVGFLRAQIARMAGMDEADVDDDAPLARFGIDSLRAAELTHELEQFLGVSLSATISFDRPTISALADALSADDAEPVASETTRPDDDNTTQPHRTPARARHARVAGRVVNDTGAAGDTAIAIVGMSCRFPGAPSLERFWQLLERGEDAVSEIPAERAKLGATPAVTGSRFGGFVDGIDRFDAAFFGISPAEAARMDPQQRLFLELAWVALEDAGIAPSTLRGSDTGVFAGVGANDYALLHAGRPELIDADSGVGHAASVVANRVSYALDLGGPSMTVDTACSSALVALHLACQSLRTGESGLAIAGGVNAMLSPEPGLFLVKARTLASDGRCKTFDVRADGFVRSEGCGVIVLKRLPDAVRARDRIYGVIQGSAVNHDGASNGIMAPSGPAQERLVHTALARAGITPDQLDYIEAHGAGAPLADAVELGALARVLADRPAGQPCRIGSVKTNLGHLEAASGIAGVIKTALALTHERIPAHLHLREVAALPAPFAIPTEAVAWRRNARPRYAGVSAFGMGGANAHVVLREAPIRTHAERTTDRREHVLALSAKDPRALGELAAALGAQAEPASLAALCYSANTGRDHFAHRAAIVVSDAASLRAGLRRIEAAAAQSVRGREPQLTFAFDDRLPAVGAVRDLYATEPAFRRALERGAAVASGVLDADLLPALTADATVADPDQPRLEHPQTSALLVQYALHALFEHWGVQAAAVFGVGVGEYAAACVAGVLDWHDALRLIARRELLLGSLVPGGRVRQTLHQFKTALAAIDYAPAVLPLTAATTGRVLPPGETLSAAHWLGHLYAKPGPELADGPERPAYAGTAELQLSGAGSSCSEVLGTLATLYERGCKVDWRAFHAGFERDRVPLPSYPFQRQRCWLDLQPTAANAPAPANAPSAHPFLSQARVRR